MGRNLFGWGIWRNHFKKDFLPLLLNEWEIYWDVRKRDLKELSGTIEQLDSVKQASWRKFQLFMECYDELNDIISFGYQLDEMEFYPLVVLAMMNYFNAEACYEEYCEWEFFTSGEWESIDLTDEDNEEDESPIFFCKEI